MGKYLTEFIGTFFLVLTIGCTVIPGRPNVIPALAIGAVLMVMIFAGGHVSGGHYNPAVTLGVWLRGKCPTSDVVPYWAAQLVGAIVASVVVRGLVGAPEDALLTPKPGPAFIAEFVFTFALVYVVLNVATAKGTSGNSFYGLAIGMTVMSGAFAVGGVSGAAFNPAVVAGVGSMGLIAWANLWPHVLAEAAAGAAAAYTFKTINPDDK
jgi:aquaporin Z